MCSNMSLILFGPMQHLTGIKGLSEAKVDKICEAAEKIVVRAPLMHYKMSISPTENLLVVSHVCTIFFFRTLATSQEVMLC